MLEYAISLAVKQHSEQTDKAGEPYILHPLRIMSKFRIRDEQIVAVLHDVVEDTNITLENLRVLGYNSQIINSIDKLTRRENENYNSYINRASMDNIALLVKIEDLKDNLDNTRLKKVTPEDISRTNRYLKSLAYLNDIFRG